MDLNGLWVAEFSANGGHGSGVLAVSGNQLLGGDSSYFYSGEIHLLERSGVRGTLSIQHFAGPQNSIFGPSPQVALTFDGAASGELIVATLRNQRNPFAAASVKLRRVVRVGR